MRKLFIWSTTLFWLAVLGFWSAGLLLPHENAVDYARPEPKLITLTELSSHNRIDDCWMAIEDVVYDLSAYVPQHPSPPDVLLPWCGREATQAYLTKMKNRPHSAYADTLLEKYEIGRLAGATDAR